MHIPDSVYTYMYVLEMAIEVLDKPKFCCSTIVGFIWGGGGGGGGQGVLPPPLAIGFPILYIGLPPLGFGFAPS